MGSNIDLGALILQNESVRAVGNMKVNSRGDIINTAGEPTMTRSQQVNKNLQRQRVNTKSEPVLSSQPRPQKSQPQQVSSPTTQTTEASLTAGIGAAIQRAKKKK